MAEPPSPSEPPSGGEPIASRLLETGVGVTQRVARVTGVGQALDTASEEAIVRAFESPAVARALIRLAEDGELLDVFERALGSADVEDAVTKALDSQAADRIWAEILASDKAQMLVERVADAPEVRAAIAQQGIGLISDIGLQIRRLTRPLDGALERVAQALLGRGKREEKTEYAGFVTRLLAGALDLVLIFGGLSIASGVIASIFTAVFGQGDGLSAAGLVIAVAVGLSLAGSLIVMSWAFAGQTPGMRFLGIRLDVDGERRIGVRRATRRLFGVALSLIPAGLGFFAILVDRERRGWYDRMAETTVLYDDSRSTAPYSKLPNAAPGGQAAG